MQTYFDRQHRTNMEVGNFHSWLDKKYFGKNKKKIIFTKSI